MENKNFSAVGTVENIIGELTIEVIGMLIVAIAIFSFVAPVFAPLIRSKYEERYNAISKSMGYGYYSRIDAVNKIIDDKMIKWHVLLWVICISAWTYTWFNY